MELVKAFYEILKGMIQKKINDAIPENVPNDLKCSYVIGMGITNPQNKL